MMLRSSLFLVTIHVALLGAGPSEAQQASGSQLPTAPTIVAEDYKLGPKDRISISVEGLPDLQTTTTISDDGTIRMGLIGDVVAEGFTVRGLENVLAAALERFVNNPAVSVTVDQYGSQSFFMYGAINESGSFPITGRVSLLEALVQAGGIDPNEAAGPITIVRRDLPQEPIEIDGRELFFKGNRAYDIQLRPGDMINVVRKPEYSIYIYDERGQGGMYRFRDPVSLLQAVSLTGGLGDGASKKVKIIRTNEDDTKETFEVNFGDILEGKAEDVMLAPGDVIIIKRGFF